LSAFNKGAGSDRDFGEMTPAELSAYINRIIKGLPDEDNTPETKALRAIAAAITKLVDEVAALAEQSERMEQYLDELDSDLGELEADYYGDYYDDFSNYDYDDGWPSGVSQYGPIIFSDQEPDEIEQNKDEGDGKDKG